jgi:hypothetical protein
LRLKSSKTTSMAGSDSSIDDKLAHYRAWSKAWLSVEPSLLSPDQCLAVLIQQGPKWLQVQRITESEAIEFMHMIIACFKTATKARLIPLGGQVLPSRDEYNVLSESYDARIDCHTIQGRRVLARSRGITTASWIIRQPHDGHFRSSPH